MRPLRVQTGVLCAWFLLLAVGCTAAKPALSTYVLDLPRVEQPPGTHRRPAPVAAPIRARILLAGDLLMHLPLVTSSEVAPSEWDFKPIFAPVQPWVAAADLAIANLETTLAGPKFPWAGYPSFNTPAKLARDVKAVGFDALLRANNHALDYGEYGLVKTSEALDRYGIPFTGASRTPAEQEQILVLEVTPGIRMAVLNYSYGTNGIPLPQPHSVNLLDPDRIRADIARAKALPNVDLVLFAPHMGEEYARNPSSEQESYFDLALEAGADIVMGNHPHVIQKIEWRRGRVVIFSIGNFISNQVGLPREAGLMLLLDVKKEQEKTVVERVAFLPTWLHPHWIDGRQRYRVVTVEKAMRDFEAGTDPLITSGDYQRLKEVWTDTQDRAVGGPDVKLQRVDEPARLVR